MTETKKATAKKKAAPAAPVAAAEPKRRGRPKKAAPAGEVGEVEAVPAARVQRVGYVRVSTSDQNTARQLDGVSVDKVFTDYASGKDTARPELQKMLSYVREGDTVVVHSLDRLGRNLSDLRQLVADLNGRGVRVEFVTGGLPVFEPGGGGAAFGGLLLNILGAFAEFERNMMLERQREGIRKAKEAGKYKGGAPALKPDLAAQFRARVLAGGKVADLAAEFGVSRATGFRLASEARQAASLAPAAPEPVAPLPAPPAPAPVPVPASRRGPVPASLRRVLAALKAAGGAAQWDSQLGRWVAGEEVVQRGQLEKLVERGELVREGEGAGAVYRLP